jgi:hypothetical protein
MAKAPSERVVAASKVRRTDICQGSPLGALFTAAIAAAMVDPLLPEFGCRASAISPDHAGLRAAISLASFPVSSANKNVLKLPECRDGPLGEAVDAKPWKGARPCLPDMLPVIGRAPRHAGLWFGRHHHGLTLGPATGRLLAEMMTGKTPCADPAPFRRALRLTIPVE